MATFYRPDPDNFPNNLSTRDNEIIGTVISGSKQIFEVDLDVVEGDYIGVYFTDGYICSSFGYSNIWINSGDYIPCQNKTFIVGGEYAVSLYGTGYTERGELTVGSELMVSYITVGIPICFRRDDKDSITDRIEKEGGDGIIEFCITDNNIDSIAWANEVAKADLLKNADPTIRATFVTNRSDIKSGQIITLNSTKRNINQQFIVQSVELIRVDVWKEYPIIPLKPSAIAKIELWPSETSCPSLSGVVLG